MANPIGLIKTVISREMANTLGETYINAPGFTFNPTHQPQDAWSSAPAVNRISSDSADEWFLMGVSKWGEVGKLVSD